MSTLQGWLPIVISLLILVVGGGGWWQYLLARRREKQEQYRAVLYEFLRPFEAKLKETAHIFRELTVTAELDRLEYSPAQLQHRFRSLPPAEPLRMAWQLRIERLQQLNRDAIGLIDRFYGRIQLDRFRNACDEFKYHADNWEDLWKALMGREDIPAEMGGLNAPLFPSDLEPALLAEMSTVAGLAGLSSTV